MKLPGSIVSAFAALAILRADAASERMFPFVISYDAPENIVDMRSLLKAPAGSCGRVFVKDGHWERSVCYGKSI